eukprot:TRINITY_DN29290_c0_g1_i1.p1 TRINITY_DN29290_c0_g1~~TRINITY_DN29290_c0_g1_i1.p1  ORF type:complete len:357 (+),score=56.09 TRINITY_DN29290_c0_g1_i1:52-1122(+)
MAEACVVGRPDTSMPEAQTQRAEERKPQRYCNLVKTCSACALLALQISVIWICDPICESQKFWGKEISLLERVAWMSPLYFIAPWSAMALLVAVGESDRYSQTSFLHRFSWRFALCNMIVTISMPLPELLRDCHGKQAHAISAVGDAGEAVWVISYVLAEVAVLSLIRHRIQVAARPRSALAFSCLLATMAVTGPLSFLPVFVSLPIDGLTVRVFFGSCYTVAFAACTLTATCAILGAASSAEVILLDKNRCTSQGEDDPANMWIAIVWTRRTAYLTCGSMASSLLLQLALLAWAKDGFHGDSYKVASDWMAALDFTMNAACVACLSGLVGSNAHVDTVNMALGDVGNLLAENDRA